MPQSHKVETFEPVDDFILVLSGKNRRHSRRLSCPQNWDTLHFIVEVAHPANPDNLHWQQQSVMPLFADTHMDDPLGLPLQHVQKVTTLFFPLAISLRSFRKRLSMYSNFGLCRKPERRQQVLPAPTLPPFPWQVPVSET
jgi:hypothetical protein